MVFANHHSRRTISIFFHRNVALLGRLLCNIFLGSKMGPSTSSVCDFISELLILRSRYTNVFLMRGYGKTRISFFVRVIKRPHRHETINAAYEAWYSRSSSSSTELYWYPDRTRTKKKVTPLQSSHRHHRPARAASARAARGQRFDPKREATAPGCRARSASRDHRVGSLVGQDQTQAHSNSSTTVVRVHRCTRCQPDLVDNS